MRGLKGCIAELESTTGACAPLAQVIEARVALQRPLASLAGRLDLLVAHMPQPGAAAAGEDDVGAPLVSHLVS